MKFLYLTDTHIRGTNPKNRLDNFFETIKKKLNEVLEISIENSVDYILHGGDLFDRPDISVGVVSEVSNIFRQFRAPIYIVSGNHDIFGHNTTTLNRTMLGLLTSLGILNLVNEKKIILEKDVRVQLSAAPFIAGNDDPENRENYILKEKPEGVDYAIHMTHGLLIDKPFITGVAHTLISDILDTKADITLGGHYHYGFKTVNIDGKYFANPGAMVRISNTLAEMKRRPKVLLIELTDHIDIKDIYLKSAEPGDLVLDRTEIERHKFKGIKLNEFKEIIYSSGDYKNIEIESLLLDIAKNDNIPKEVRDEALKRIEEAQINGARYT